MNPYFKLRISGIVIAFLLSGQAFALTVYDVIQLSKKDYTDDNIIALIEATDSAFELKAEDLPRLIDLGVSETVIQTMLKTVTKHVDNHSLSSPSQTAVPSGNSSDLTIHPTPTSRTPLIIAGGRFETTLFEERGSGHHHQHQIISLADVNLFVLRSKGTFSSIKNRADATVIQLEQAVLAGQGVFKSEMLEGNRVVIFYGKKTLQSSVILTVSSTDAYAYQNRSGRNVTPTLLAAYWSALLSDYWSIAVNDVNPVQLTHIHEGEALTALYEQWKASHDISSARLDDVAQLLSRQIQQHLLHLATTVPRDFLSHETHSMVEQP